MIKKKYKVCLLSLVILIILFISITFSYGIWLSNKSDDNLLSYNDCIDIIYSNQDYITMDNPLSISDDDGYGTTPYPFVISNNCSTNKEIELRLDILNNNSIELNKIKVYVNGDIELKPVILDTLVSSKVNDPDSTENKLLIRFNINSNETIRGNIRVWLDKNSTLSPNKNIFSSKMYFTSEETIIKPKFKEILLSKEGLENINNKISPDYSSIANTYEGLYASIDEEGTSYFFRGDINDNYVYFADLLWRIIRINGNGSIRIILNDSDLIGNYNLNKNNEKYVGYTYEDNGSTVNSNIKTLLDNWYEENIKNKGYDKYLVNEYFCNDTSYTKVNNSINFKEYDKLFISDQPSLKCNTSDKTYGGVYKEKVGLITSSEAVMAGATLNVSNSNYYLYNNKTFYTMSPIDYSNNTAYVGVITKNGAFYNVPASNEEYIRPVINLSNITTVTGTGTINDPYLIDNID